MKVHLIRKETIEAFGRQHAQARTSLQDLLIKLKKADWEKPTNIKVTFRNADLLGKSSSRVIIDMSGNNYRMSCSYAFGEKNVQFYVCWIGTHAAYDELCKNNEQYTVSNY